VGVCPLGRDAAGAPANATACSTDSLQPNDEELAAGKRLSCECGDAVCDQLPATRLLVSLSAEGSRQAASLQLYAGMPAQTAQPNTTEFAYPGYWAGALHSCAWTKEPCGKPLPDTEQCLVLSCADAVIACPPPGTGRGRMARGPLPSPALQACRSARAATT